MTDQNSKLSNASGQERRWRFWFLISFSAFLVVTFGFYLPLWFRHQAEPRHEVGEVPRHVHEVHHVEYHEEAEVREGLAVNLNVTPVPFVADTPLRFDFLVNEKPGNRPVTDLEIDHERLMHVIAVRNDLNQFFHIHPNFTDTPGLFSLSHIFPQPGLYKIWSEIKRAGVNHIFDHPEIAVEGAGERFKKEVIFNRLAITNGYQVALHYDEPIPKGREVTLHFDIHDSRGQEAQLEPYLAVPMHLTIIKDDLKQFLHTHPLSQVLGNPVSKLTWKRGFQVNETWANAVHEEVGADDDFITFHTTFPEAGNYKLFAQFRPKGIGFPPDNALLAEFWVKVEEKAPLAIPLPIIYTLVSLILMAILSWGVYRYLKVKA